MNEELKFLVKIQKKIGGRGGFAWGEGGGVDVNGEGKFM